MKLIGSPILLQTVLLLLCGSGWATIKKYPSWCFTAPDLNKRPDHITGVNWAVCEG